MATEARKAILPNGQAVIEAHCPFDSTMVYRIPDPSAVPIKEEKDEQSGLDSDVSGTESENSFDDFEE